MGILDNAKKKASELLNSESGESRTDALLDKAADAAKRTLGEDKAAKIDQVRDKIDERIGHKDDTPDTGTGQAADANDQPHPGTTPGAAPGNS
ncbi:hypothetical protein HMPREF0290_1424 [Corynebacterium efficiens YS-314]|uniref:Antitoxin n=1 Tax=Corynebacterium efficiens (strain DSM 44549 / YS-314 / AJ 12310 / JCM 11189 / NBRC 100395) TaxID=196164 RepID=Q8FQT3_COREF|nr:hypothetical protein HMPREF0290_1424 [Corynebacterium efficiens YS-314]BAC17846.1 hypothetical protein [Corynebacterium efficiens YS-314]